MNNKLKRYTKSVNADIYINAAMELGLTVDFPLDEQMAIYKISDGKKDSFFWNNHPPFNSHISSKIARNKYVTSALLNGSYPGIAPQSLLIKLKDYDSIEGVINAVMDFGAELKTAFVIKPVDSSLGKGVSLNLSTSEDVRRAIELIQELGFQRLLVEEYLAGEEYRVLCFQHRVIDIIRRTPANVRGDGIHTIEDLVSKKNEYRESIDAKKLVINHTTDKMLSLQKLTLQSVPEKDSLVQLQESCNFALGGDVEVVGEDEIGQEAVGVCEKAAVTLDLAYVGIDLMIVGGKPIIGEANSSAMVDIHYNARVGEDDPFKCPKVILSRWFEN